MAALVFQCGCGKPLRANSEAAGKKTKCPHCGAVLAIPGGVEKPASTGPDDPFAPDLDWSTLQAEATPVSARSGSGLATATTADPARAKIGASAIEPATPAEVTAEAPPPADGSKQYKVLAQKDQGFAGKFSPNKLEEILNDHARRGWSLRATSTVTIHGHTGDHQELILILER